MIINKTQVGLQTEKKKDIEYFTRINICWALPSRQGTHAENGVPSPQIYHFNHCSGVHEAFQAETEAMTNETEASMAPSEIEVRRRDALRRGATFQGTLMIDFLMSLPRDAMHPRY